MISTELYGYRTDALREEIEDRLVSGPGSAFAAFASWTSGRLREAYLSGLSDGYAQGVAAKHHEEES